MNKSLTITSPGGGDPITVEQTIGTTEPDLEVGPITVRDLDTLDWSAAVTIGAIVACILILNNLKGA